MGSFWTASGTGCSPNPNRTAGSREQTMYTNMVGIARGPFPCSAASVKYILYLAIKLRLTLGSEPELQST